MDVGGVRKGRKRAVGDKAVGEIPQGDTRGVAAMKAIAKTLKKNPKNGRQITWENWVRFFNTFMMSAVFIKFSNYFRNIGDTILDDAGYVELVRGMDMFLDTIEQPFSYLRRNGKAVRVKTSVVAFATAIMKALSVIKTKKGGEDDKVKDPLHTGFGMQAYDAFMAWANMGAVPGALGDEFMRMFFTEKFKGKGDAAIKGRKMNITKAIMGYGDVSLNDVNLATGWNLKDDGKGTGTGGKAMGDANVAYLLILCKMVYSQIPSGVDFTEAKLQAILAMYKYTCGIDENGLYHGRNAAMKMAFTPKAVKDVIGIKRAKIMEPHVVTYHRIIRVLNTFYLIACPEQYYGDFNIDHDRFIGDMADIYEMLVSPEERNAFIDTTAVAVDKVLLGREHILQLPMLEGREVRGEIH